MRLAVFASGSGSNFAAILESIKAQRLKQTEVALLVCDRPGAYAIQRAEQASVPVFSFRAGDYSSKSDYEQMIVDQLLKKQVDFIVLAGYMRLIGETLLHAFQGRIINVHPSLLPAFTGKDAIGQALNYGVKVTGVTVHLVDEGMDTGPIIAQRPIIVEEDETRESLTQKIQEQEHLLLPEVISWFAEGRVQIRNNEIKSLIIRGT